MPVNLEQQKWNTQADAKRTSCNNKDKHKLKQSKAEWQRLPSCAAVEELLRNFEDRQTGTFADHCRCHRRFYMNSQWLMNRNGGSSKPATLL